MRYILILLLSITLLKAADAPKVRENSSDQAMMFELSTVDDQLINNYIYGLGYRWYAMDNLSFAIGVGFNSTEFDESSDTLTSTSNLDSWGINPSVRYNFSSNKNIIGFIGADYSYFTSTSINTINDVENEQVNNNNSFGVFVGADWFFTKNISLTAQYRISYGTRSEESLLNGEIQSSNKETFSRLGMSAFKLGLSFYFN